MPLIASLANRSFLLAKKRLSRSPSTVDYLIIAGGGGSSGGSPGATGSSGGAGAGGFVQGSGLNISASNTGVTVDVSLVVSVGAGGAGGLAPGGTSPATDSSNGSNSGIYLSKSVPSNPFSPIWANGGGKGGGYSSNPSESGRGMDGGSGGGHNGQTEFNASRGIYPGSGFISSTRQGYDSGMTMGNYGPYNSSGGGGGGNRGQNASDSSPGASPRSSTYGGPVVPEGSNGGIGIFSSISGANTAYVGGGGGGTNQGNIYTSTGGGGNTALGAYSSPWIGTPFGGGRGGIGGDGVLGPGSGPAPYGLVGTNGVSGTGGGGGGAASFSAASWNQGGGSGGSGVIIVSYPNEYDPLINVTGSPEISDTGSNRVYKWTGIGSFATN